MIRGNLATRPFYNDGLVNRWLAIMTLLVLGFTAYNTVQFLTYTRSDTDLRTRTEADQTRAAELRAAAVTLSQGQDAEQTEATRAAVVEANQIISQRTFSWTALFNHLEASLPADVRITAVRPEDQGGLVRPLAIAVVARDAGAIDAFMRNLEGTGAFAGALAVEERVNEAGDVEGAITVLYRSSASAAEGAQ
ncbi:MAG: PilN domain-containing protein [Vicinamibacterales bacterium]